MRYRDLLRRLIIRIAVRTGKYLPCLEGMAIEAMDRHYAFSRLEAGHLVGKLRSSSSLCPRPLFSDSRVESVQGKESIGMTRDGGHAIPQVR